jgi:hypothetical protein
MRNYNLNRLDKSNNFLPGTMSRSFLVLLLVLIAAAIETAAQRCENTNLSRKYDFITSTVKGKNPNDNSEEISEVHLQIVNKANKNQIQQIIVKAEYLFPDEFTDCSAVRSYITGVNKNADADDNDFGSLIVADFNFDKREDFAVKDSSGGNGGPGYAFYIQNELGKFKEDSFLSGYFPATIDVRRKRLVTYSHADVGHYWERIFIYNPATKKWTALKPRYRKNLGT